MQITVGYARGGGFDTYTRTFAEHLQNALPSDYRVVVTNKPGANTLVAARSVIDKDYQDDHLDIVVVISILIQWSILDEVRGFDAANDLYYLGAPFTPSDQTWCIRTDLLDDPNNALNEYFAGNFTLGQIGRVDTYATSTEWAVQVGFPFERAFGYSGTTELDRAFNSKEIEMTPTCRDSQAQQNPHWAEGYATPLFYTRVEPEWVKAGKAQGKWQWVDSIRNIAEDRLNASFAYLDALDMLLDFTSSNRIFAMPRQTPEPIVNAMRVAFEQVVQSDAFVADTRRGYDYDIGLRSGEAYQAQVERFAGLPDETLAVVRGLFP